MRYLTLGEILAIYRRVMDQSGGMMGVRDVGALESSVSQPRMSFEGNDLYMTLAEKAASLGYSIIQNHPFIDGNKRTGHAAMEMFLLLNGYEIRAGVNEQMETILMVASGKLSRKALTVWLNEHAVEKD